MKAIEEVWKPINGYEGLYEVSNTGEVRSLRNGGKNLNQGKGVYNVVSLWKEGVGKTLSVHTIVAKTFLGGQYEGLQVNHKDEDKRNNHVSNLEWLTPSLNTLHSSHKLRGSLQGRSKLGEEDVIEIRKKLEEGVSQSSLASVYGVHKGTISNIACGRNWGWLT